MRRPQLTRGAARPRGLLRNVSLATRLALVVVIVAIVSVIVTSIVGLQRGRQLADTAIRDRLSAIGAARGDEVERYIAGVERAVVGQAISPRSAVAIAELVDVYRDLELEGVSRADLVDVEDYYGEVVAPTLSEVRGVPVSASSLLPISDAALTLQAEYVVPRDDNDVEPNGIPEWAEIHDPLNRAFSEFVLQNGVDDFYLISADDEIVVYSTAKEIDFATSLSAGPQSGSPLSALINTLSKSAVPGTVAIRDFAPYAPAGDHPSAFVASPVFADGELVGFVAARFGTLALSAITTNDESWEELGESGETYVVASDDRMRSDARLFLEDERAYFDAVTEAGTANDDEIRSMMTFGTTVLFQPIDYQQVDEAFESPASVAEETNYLGVQVLSSRRALDIEGLEWAIFAEAHLDEIERPIDDFVRNLLIAIAVFIVIVTFFAVRWADRLLLPLRTIADRLRAIRDGGDVRGKTVLPEHSAREFVELGEDIDTMIRTLRARSLAASSRAAERRRVLRRLLPPQIAERAEAGDRDVVDQIPIVTVAVIVVRGLGSLIADGSPDRAREVLDRLVEEADDAARDHGLERVQLTGDAYFAACGVTRVHLDHASRATSFVLDVFDLIDDLESDGAISVSAGLDTGPIAVGLTGGERLVHDTWGPTVQAAADLARTARPGQILASAAVQAQLPANFEVEPSHLGDDISVVTGLRTESELPR